jgi:hypothetical protein
VTIFDGAPSLQSLSVGEPAAPLPPLQLPGLSAAPVPLPAAPAALPVAPAPAWGQFQRRPNIGMLILAICTLGFFAGGFAGGMNGLLFMAMLVGCLVGMGMEGHVSAHNRLRPMARSNELAIRAALKAASGSSLLERAVDLSYVVRGDTYAAALKSPPPALWPLLGVLSLAVESETSDANVWMALGALAHAGAPALPYLRALHSRAPAIYTTKVDAAIASASAPPAGAAPAVEPRPAEELPSRFDAAKARARQVLDASERDSLPRSFEARALEEALRSLEEAVSEGDEEKAAVSLARLEALLSGR